MSKDLNKWVNTTLPEEDYYIRVLLDGMTISVGDLEITKLNRRYVSPDKVEIQIYKRNLNNAEYLKTFYNLREAVEHFLSLKRKYYFE